MFLYSCGKNIIKSLQTSKAILISKVIANMKKKYNNKALDVTILQHYSTTKFNNKKYITKRLQEDSSVVH